MFDLAIEHGVKNPYSNGHMITKRSILSCDVTYMVFLSIHGVETLSEDFYLHEVRGSLRIIAVTRPIQNPVASEIKMLKASF
jgi:hypothetical protein